MGIILIAINSLLSACGGQVVRSTPNYFIPPTLVSTAEVIILVSPTPLPPTPTPSCDNRLVFDRDVTVPDLSEFAPGAPIDKVWGVTNSGSCNWDAGFVVRLISGDAMGADAEQALFPARSGSQAELRINFVAPDDAGTYQSSWQAYGPNGEPFGDLFFIVIKVEPRLLEAPTEEGSP
ncbi:MAG: NBR1-Ig-like domain-containing protein [Chloroflexota bacterium]